MKVRSLAIQEIIEHQGDARLAQAAPVNGTWYTVLATALNVVLYYVSFEVATTGEDLELEIVIDGVTLTASQAAVAGTNYYLRVDGSPDVGADSAAASATAGLPYMGSFPLTGRSVQIRIRKTSANGAGTITCKVGYGRLS